MKYLLLSALFSLNVEYADLSTCEQALEQVKQHDKQAICIPAGKDKGDQMFDKFLGMVQQLQKLDNQKTQTD
jgi:hypothetical protein